VADRRDGATVAVLDAIGIEGGAVAGDDHEAEEQAGDDHEGDVDDHDDGHDEGVDPHVWLDPTLMAAIVDEVTAALVALDPEGATGYEEAAAAYRGELAALDASYQEALDDCRSTTIVVAHEAFGWLASRYGLTQEGISGLAPGAEPSPTRLAELTDLVTELGVTTVFTETLVSPRTAEALAREAGVATAVLDPLEGLSDAQRAAGGSYGTVMERNLATLVEALGCA
jgi:zinc transport system substrate-binding protein